MKLKIKQDFVYFHKGTQRAEYAAGAEVETEDEEMAAVAITEGWAEEAKDGKQPAENKAKKAAPENKSAD